MSELMPQDLANMALAFSTAGEPGSTLLDPILVLDARAMHSAQLRRVHYAQMSMQCLVRAGQIVAGFVLLGRAETRGLLSVPDENCYILFRMLREFCRSVGDFDGASRVQAMVHRLGLIANVAPAAMTPARST
eukprot:gnl/TRDRNA2_/TRDRNA2_174633_c5_seq1.p3 gnl/TRDRNA2_/TRDRNA2_174633_c5~~gnl/TRDRNA2_/TRDRNA2_174633_c5_seq1.p3  ORF type:complete len:133 (+),score=14.93 gnl/TRDRNA2_/TRDRNA2_174633_c5_seq1:449-847(+)